MTPLVCAVSRGKAIAVRYLLEKGADPNKEDIVGFTPLHYATKEGTLSALFHIFMFNILSLHPQNSSNYCYMLRSCLIWLLSNGHPQFVFRLHIYMFVLQA
jgi:hypothetical protein